MLTVSIADVLSFNPCESESAARMEELFAGRERISALDILAMDIPDEHKYWLILRPELIDEATLTLIKTDLLDLMDDKNHNIYLKTVNETSCGLIINRVRNYLGKPPLESLHDTFMPIILKHIS